MDLTEELFVALVTREREPGYWDWQELARRAEQIATAFSSVHYPGRAPSAPLLLPEQASIVYIASAQSVFEVKSASLRAWLESQPRVA